MRRETVLAIQFSVVSTMRTSIGISTTAADVDEDATDVFAANDANADEAAPTAAFDTVSVVAVSIAAAVAASNALDADEDVDVVANRNEDV